jgi:exportin-1
MCVLVHLLLTPLFFFFSLLFSQGAIATKMSLIRSMRSAKKEVLRLLCCFVENSGEPEAGPAAVAQGFIPPVLDPILGKK